MIALMVLAALLCLGWCLGTREIELEVKTASRTPCGCKRCWYVGEVPEGVPSCPWLSHLSFSGVRGVLMVAAIAGLPLLLNNKGRSLLSGWPE